MMAGTASGSSSRAPSKRRRRTAPEGDGNKMIKRMIGLMVMSLGLGACGGTDAPAKCSAFGDRACARFSECSPGGGSCTAAFAATLNCTTARGLSSRYEECMALMGSNTCQQLFPMGTLVLPDACQGVILY